MTVNDSKYMTAVNDIYPSSNFKTTLIFSLTEREGSRSCSGYPWGCQKEIRIVKQAA